MCLTESPCAVFHSPSGMMGPLQILTNYAGLLPPKILSTRETLSEKSPEHFKLEFFTIEGNI